MHPQTLEKNSATCFSAKDQLKVAGNRFKIAGGKAGMEVSWQLTGVRKDAYAENNRTPVEEMKPAEERGSYLHPEAFGKSAEMSVQRAHEKANQN